MILYQGPSMLDGQPIVVLATGYEAGRESANTKTGSMLQTWILRSDVYPTDAVKTGLDASICGDCPHRGGPCYVRVDRAPLSTFKRYLRGGHPTPASKWTIESIGSGYVVRIGAYGDPAAVPVWVWDTLTRRSLSHTGYTHQWRTALHLRHLCMASVDSVDELVEARRLGWRTFRVTRDLETIQEREVVCPASSERGHMLTCSDCKGCGGGSRRGSFVIQAHGIMASKIIVDGGVA